MIQGSIPNFLPVLLRVLLEICYQLQILECKELVWRRGKVSKQWKMDFYLAITEKNRHESFLQYVWEVQFHLNEHRRCVERGLGADSNSVLGPVNPLLNSKFLP